MARLRGVVGFETGDLTGLGAVGASAADILLNAAIARTGQGYFNAKVTGAVQNKAVTITIGDAISGGNVDVLLRVFFKPVTFPSSNDLSIAKLGLLGLDMNTTGALRLSGVGANSSYAGTTIVGHWYRADFHLWGVEKTGVVVNSMRQAGTIDVYDHGTDGLTDPPTLLHSFVSDSYNPTIVGVLAGGCFTPGIGYFCGDLTPAGGLAFFTMVGKIMNYDVIVSGCQSTLFNGTYTSNLGSETDANYVFGGNSVVSSDPGPTGSYYEEGILLKTPAIRFQPSNTPFGTIIATIGQANQGPGVAREINYDDIYYDFGTGADAGNSIFPKGTRVQPYPITAQGSFDQFADAGDYDAINSIPGSGADFVQGTFGQETTYLHANLANAADVVYHLRVWANAIDFNDTTQGIFIGSNESILGFHAFTGSFDGNTPKADLSQVAVPMSSTTFNALEYGAKNESNPSTFRLFGLMMEVLTGPPGTIYNDATTLTPDNVLLFSAVEGGGVVISAPRWTDGPPIPTQWALQRMDIRIEDQDDQP